MGIYDREYYQPETDRGFGSSIAQWPWTYRLIALNVVVFLVDALSDHVLIEWGNFNTTQGVLGLQIWRFLTFQFLHDPRNLGHLFGNMLALYCFGTVVERELGRRQFLALYLLSGVSGAILFAASNLIGFLRWGPLIGASAGVLGVIAACAVIAPNVIVNVMFVFPMRLKTFAIVVIGLAVVYFVNQSANAGGEAAHLGGAAVGFLLIKNRRWLAWFDDFQLPGRFGRGRLRMPTLSSLLPDRSVSDEELDRLLDKVREHGLDSLSSREKSTLKRASRERRSRQRR